MDPGQRIICPLSRIITVVLAIFAGSAAAQFGEPPPLLMSSEAFRLQATRAAPARIILIWTIEPGYYLYRDRFRFHRDDGEPLAITTMPPGEHKNDPYFGPTRIFRQRVVIEVTLDGDTLGRPQVPLRVVSQGCADIGVCFPPQTARFALATGDTVIARPDDIAAAASDAQPNTAGDPLAALTAGDAGGLPFIRIRDNASLEVILMDARRRRAPAMLSFYADWCVPCREIEQRTLSTPAVRKALADTLLLRADVSANTPEHLALMSRFGLSQPPAILFFDRDGLEQAEHRVTGFMAPGPFAARLQNATR